MSKWDNVEKRKGEISLARETIIYMNLESKIRFKVK